MNPIDSIEAIIKTLNVVLTRNLRVNPEDFFKDRYFDIGMKTNNFQTDGESKFLVAMDVATNSKYEINVVYHNDTQTWEVIPVKTAGR